MDALQTYWKNAFGAYANETEEGTRFEVPGFPDPLLSAFFLKRDACEPGPKLPHFNWIGEGAPAFTGFQRQRSFMFGEVDISREKSFELVALSLEEAMRRSDYWQLLGDCFERDLPFLHKFLPFLPSLPVRTGVILFEDGGKLAGAVTVLRAGEVALVMNLCVAPRARSKLLGPKLIVQAKRLARTLGAEKVIFWTHLPKLRRYCDKVWSYGLYVNMQ